MNKTLENYLKEDIKRCVELLNVEGKNTKLEVKCILQEILEVYFKDFSMSEVENNE